MNQITIESSEPAVNKKKEIYYKYKTSDGDMSCFEQSIFTQLNANCIGKLVNLEVAERNGYKNIVKLEGEAIKAEVVPSDPQPAPIPPLPHQLGDLNNPAFRAKVTQTAKGHHYWELTVRADTLDEMKRRLFDAVVTMQAECDRLNFGEEKPKEVVA